MNTVAWITSKGEQHDIKDIEARRRKLDIDDLPRNVAFFINDAGYITNAVNDLVNYYKKSETYTKEQIDAIVTPKLAILIVEQLPTQDISTTTIYFLRRNRPSGTTQYESDVYDEYIYVNGTWELIGNTYVDLSDYYTKSETDTQIETQIGVESQAREDSDSLLQTNINNVQTNLNLTNQNLNAEISAREVKNLQHETDISANTTAIQAERTRAMGAESTLAERCDTYDSHLANTNNPHSVTKAQVGLGNVTNVATTNTITNNSNQNITSGAVYTGLAGKVDKVTGKGLSDENYTYAEKTKLAGLSNYNDTALKNRVTATENAITTLNGNSSVNGSVDKKIADAIGGITQIDFQIVQTLPETGVKGVIYFVPSESTGTQNTYTEYVWLGSSYEEVGKFIAKVDLSDYYTKAETTALVSAKNNKITVTNNATALTDNDTFDETATGANPSATKSRKLTLLWAYIQSKLTKTDVGLANVANLDQSKAIKSITRSGTTFTATCLDDTTFTFTQQDNNTNTIPSAYCTTGADAVAKTASCTDYALLSKSYIQVIIKTANTAKGALTLSINSKTAKPIYINGSASSSSNYTLPAGSYLVYYDGTNYYFRTDGKITGSITGDAGTVNGHSVNKDVPSNALFTDTTYSNATSSASGLMSANDKKKLDLDKIQYFGTCATSRATNAKEVTCSDFVLEAGCTIVVKFTDTAGSAPTSGNITLNINGTGAKNVYNKNNSQMTYAYSGEFRANRYCEFLYDGTNFIWLNYDSNTTYSTITQAEITAGTSTSSRLVTPKLLVDNFGKVATQSTNGLMSASDKTKLDGMGSNNGITFEIV